MALDEERQSSFMASELQESCDSGGILQLVLKNKEKFEMKTDARMKKIELKPTFCLLLHLRKRRGDQCETNQKAEDPELEDPEVEDPELEDPEVEDPEV
ncbi:uncharacterized protein AKAME5_002035400 [Lates japonicus]|uniref:Uncharacterized protein n=1 Tax=Lates japonicus TaxID=270547 RepID=A0AAD3NA18_LATJO|nr:uncharacterized protein AKAME5_002035400 [Lates japonicus]